LFCNPVQGVIFAHSFNAGCPVGWTHAIRAHANFAWECVDVFVVHGIMTEKSGDANDGQNRLPTLQLTSMLERVCYPAHNVFG